MQHVDRPDRLKHNSKLDRDWREPRNAKNFSMCTHRTDSGLNLLAAPLHATTVTQNRR